jgi:hypothetical protein
MNEIAHKLACAETTIRFFQHLDNREDKECLDQFTTDGIWERSGQNLAGHAAIQQALTARSSTRRTCHLVSNIIVTLLDENRAKVDFCLTAYDGPAADAGQPTTGKMAGIRRCVDLMVNQGDRWRISNKSSVGLFSTA